MDPRTLAHGTRQAVKFISWRVAKLSFSGLGADLKQNFIILQVAYNHSE